jgi:hypothetical protein
MSDRKALRLKDSGRPGRTLVWVLASSAICCLLLVVAREATRRWCGHEELRLQRVATEEQLEEIRSGKIDCLVQPEPECIEELLADAACARNVKCLYLGGDMSDKRLTRLHALPNLETIVLLYTHDSGAFLGSFQDNPSLAALHLEKCEITAQVAAAIRKLSKVKAICLCRHQIKSSDLADLEGHPGIEQLVLDQLQPNPGLVPLLESLPRLRHLTIVQCEESKVPLNTLEAELRKALPKCQIEVRDYEGR